MTVLRIRQSPIQDGKYTINLRLQVPGQAEIEAEAKIEFALTEQEQEDLRWYLEDYLQSGGAVEAVTVAQVETMMKARGEELYARVLTFNQNTQAIWFAIRNQLADLRIEITTGVAEAASIPWELMRDPQSDSAISVRVKSFVRVQSNPNIGFVDVPPAEDGRVRLLYVVCRPGGSNDVELRAVANRLLAGLGAERARFQIKALRPPTFEQLQRELAVARDAGRPYHIVHFDGHGVYADLAHTVLKDWLSSLSHLVLGGKASGKHGYLLFEHAGEEKMRPVDGQTLGQLLHDTGVPVLVLNACQSAMHEATSAPANADTPHEEIRAIGSLAQAVIDQGIPAVLGMRYSVYVVTAAQYINQLYEALARGREFGQAATAGRRHLQLNDERWVGLQPRRLQDWFVPVVHEARPIQLIAGGPRGNGEISLDATGPDLDPVHQNPALLRYVPEHGFTGRDETLLALDRAFDAHRVVLLHAYAGQGKTTTAVEFARWYALTGGLGEQPIVIFTTFEAHTDLDDLLNHVAQLFTPVLDANDIHWSALNDAAKRRSIVVQLLRQVPLLWIWDNVEPVAGFPEGTESQWTPAEQGELRDFLHQLKLDTTTKVKILLTSRRTEEGWLDGIPHRIAMPRMRNSDAARLALSLGTEKKISVAEISNWQPLLDYCQGNPLTLRVLVGQAVKMGLHGKGQIQEFVDAIRDGEQEIADTDATQGRDRSLGASLDYGFRHAFKDDELPIIALLHLFQGTVDAVVLLGMGSVDDALPEVEGWNREQLVSLLGRAGEIGLLAHLESTYFNIHPALPWFLRQLFLRYYDGQSGHSSAMAALQSWAEAVGYVGEYYHQSYYRGQREMLRPLELEEANLLLARSYARRNQWWTVVLTTMQGLRTICGYRGRHAEWARLVTEIVPDFCNSEDDPHPGQEEGYGLVMSYRVHLLMQQELDYAGAIRLQEKSVAFRRSRVVDALTLSSDAPLDENQRAKLENLSAAVSTLGTLLQEIGDAGCLPLFAEAIAIDRRSGNRAGESISEYNIGHAYMSIAEIRDLDAAEAAYQRSLDLAELQDDLGRAIKIKQIGMVHHNRFREARDRAEAPVTVLQHAQEAQRHYLQALRLCPSGAITELAPMHNQLGNLYSECGVIESARHHYEVGAGYFEKADDYYRAGIIRGNMGRMYFEAAFLEAAAQLKRNLLLRAKAYASAALRDFQHYRAQTATDQAEMHALLGMIHTQLGEGGE